MENLFSWFISKSKILPLENLELCSYIIISALTCTKLVTPSIIAWVTTWVSLCFSLIPNIKDAADCISLLRLSVPPLSSSPSNEVYLVCWWFNSNKHILITLWPLTDRAVASRVWVVRGFVFGKNVSFSFREIKCQWLVRFMGKSLAVKGKINTCNKMGVVMWVWSRQSLTSLTTSRSSFQNAKNIPPDLNMIYYTVDYLSIHKLSWCDNHLLCWFSASYDCWFGNISLGQGEISVEQGEISVRQGETSEVADISPDDETSLCVRKLSAPWWKSYTWILYVENFLNVCGQPSRPHVMKKLGEWLWHSLRWSI